MVDIKKEDLLFTDYIWKAKDEHDDPAKRKSDSERFSRKEGYEVIYILNHGFNDDHGPVLTVKDKQRIEWLIHEHLPSGTQSRDNVKAWVNEKLEDKVLFAAYALWRAKKK